jgi:hypothetical protein
VLRNALMTIGGLFLLFAIVLLRFAPEPSIAIPPAVIGLLIVVGLLCERHLYHASADTPPADPGWEMTSERFVDPGTDELMVVWFHRRTGKRLYVRAGKV